MSVPINTTVRYVRKSQQKRGADGKKLCLVCEGALPARRSSYCSDECMVRNLPGFMRDLVRERDKGVCANCGADALYCGWEMDHIVPVIEGGGLCGLDGYRTLCIPCHKQATAELAQRLAQSRRNAKLAPMLNFT